MSSRNKDTLEKRDIPSESSESHSDSEVNKAEENLDQLMTEERLTKDDSGESKPLNPPKQVGTLTSKYDPLNEPIAGPSGLQEPRLETSHPESKVESLSDPQKEKNVEAKDIDENIEARMVEDFDTTSLFIRSSTGVTTSSMLKEKSPVAGRSTLLGEVDHLKLPTDAVSIYMTESSESSSSRPFDYTSDSAHTLSDVSEIRSEIVDISTEGVSHDAPESLEEDQSSRYACAVERQSFESVGKSKREPNLSSPPPLDKELTPSPPKAATSRPKKKKARYDKTRRTRHDSGDTVTKSLGNLQQSESTSTPDPSEYTPPVEEMETAL